MIADYINENNLSDIKVTRMRVYGILKSNEIDIHIRTIRKNNGGPSQT